MQCCGPAFFEMWKIERGVKGHWEAVLSLVDINAKLKIHVERKRPYLSQILYPAH